MASHPRNENENDDIIIAAAATIVILSDQSCRRSLWVRDWIKRRNSLGAFTSAIVLQKRRSRLWVIGSYEMPRCDWLQHCNFLAGIEILPFALQTACKPCGFAAGRPAIVAGPVLRVAIGESCSVCRALK